jgi:DnaA-homolog protein
MSPQISSPQQPLDLAITPRPSLRNFVSGRNGELLACLSRLPNAGSRTLLLWGEAGVGKSHLLAALIQRNWPWPATFCAHEMLKDGFGQALPCTLAVDDVDRLDASGQRALFNLVNRVQEEGGLLIVAAPVPPAQLVLREDLATRLGAGLVYRVHPLNDQDKRQALQSVAHERGFSLPETALDYLLNRCPRDLPWLMQALERIDIDSLAAKRPVTLSLIRSLLQI